MLSPIQARRHWIRKIAFEPREIALKNSKCQADISLRHRKCKDHWHVHLKIVFGRQENSEANYRGHIEFEGIFDVHPEFPAEKAEDLVRMNGGAILYGAIRELILTLSSRSKHGPYEMPTIDARMFLSPPKKTEVAKKKPTS